MCPFEDSAAAAALCSCFIHHSSGCLALAGSVADTPSPPRTGRLRNVVYVLVAKAAAIHRGSEVGDGKVAEQERPRLIESETKVFSDADGSYFDPDFKHIFLLQTFLRELPWNQRGN